MALKSSSPLNLAALRQDYSMLPKIAAVKAQSSQQLFNAIGEGIKKRNQKKIEAEEKAANIRVIESVLNSPLGQRVFGEDRPDAKDVYTSMGKDGQKNLVGLLTTMQNAEIAQTEQLRRLAELQRREQEAAAKALDTAIERELLSIGAKKTGALSFDGDMFNNVSKKFGVPEDKVRGIGAAIMEKRNVIGRQKIDQFSKDDPAFRDYLTALSNLPKDTTEQRNLLEMDDLRSYFPPAAIAKGIYNYIVDKKEFEAGFFDLESIEEYNQILKENPEILQAIGAPPQIVDFIGLGRLSESKDPDEELTLRDGTTVQKRNTDRPPPVQYGYPTVPQIQSF